VLAIGDRCIIASDVHNHRLVRIKPGATRRRKSGLPAYNLLAALSEARTNESILGRNWPTDKEYTRWQLHGVPDGQQKAPERLTN
jgi:hypothetical protein